MSAKANVKNDDLFASTGKKKKRGASLDVRKARAGWWFVMPFIIGFVLLYLPIVFDSIKYSFHEIRILTGGGFRLEWVGWKNYSDALFVDPSFVQTLTTGIKQLIIDIPAIVIFALFVAILLNGKIAGRAAFRAIFFIPVLLTTGLIAEIDAANIAGFCFVTAPIEMFAATGMYIKENSPAAFTFVCSCANGAMSYIPTADAYDYGCYESYTSYFAKGTAELLQVKYVEMLESLQ